MSRFLIRCHERSLFLPAEAFDRIDVMETAMPPDMKTSFTYHIPTRIEFGWDTSLSVGRLSQEFGQRILLLTQRELEGQSWFKAIRQSLDIAGGVVRLYTAIEAEADAESIDMASRRLKNETFDVIIGVGGGSVVDFAKALAVSLPSDAPIWDYVTTSSKSPLPIKGPLPPIIAIPSTAGTGSEVTPYAVISNRAIGSKATILSNQLTPAVALVDPSLTRSLPLNVRAYTGADALAHAVESFLNYPQRTPFSVMLSEEAVRTAVGALVCSATDQEDRSARQHMAWASLLSGMSIALAGTGLGHAMAEIVGGRTHIPHGLAVAAFLPAVLQLLEEDCGLSLQRLKRALGDVDVPAHSRIRELWRGAGLPTTLDDLKVSRGLIDEVRHATLTDAAWAMAPNPVHLGGEDIDRVLAYVWPDEINQGVSHSPR